MDLNGYKEIRDAYRTISESLADAPAANTPAAAAPDAKDAFPKDRVARAKKQASVKKEELEATGLFSDSEIEAILEDAEHLVELSTDTLKSYMGKAEKDVEAKLEKAREQSKEARFSRLVRNDKRAEKLDKKAQNNRIKAADRDDRIDQADTKVRKAQGTETKLDKKFPTPKGAKVPAQLSKEEAELDTFDLILEYLTGRGFPQEDAMQLMATMEDERREKITAEAVAWDKYGRPKSKEGKAKAARAQAEMRAKDKAAGRDRYGYKTGYAKKTWDE